MVVVVSATVVVGVSAPSDEAHAASVTMRVTPTPSNGPIRGWNDIKGHSPF